MVGPDDGEPIVGRHRKAPDKTWQDAENKTVAKEDIGQVVEDDAVVDTQVGDHSAASKTEGIVMRMEIMDEFGVASTVGTKRKAPDKEDDGNDEDMEKDDRGRPQKRPRTVPPLHLWIWLDGKLARALFDTGCNTFSIDEGFAQKNGIKIEKSKEPFNISWGQDGLNYKTSKIATVEMKAFDELRKEKFSMGKHACLVAPLRVDVIIGLPFIHDAKKLSVSAENERRLCLDFELDGTPRKVHALQSVNRKKSVKINAAESRGFKLDRKEKPSDNIEIVSRKKLRQGFRKKLYKEVFQVAVTKAKMKSKEDVLEEAVNEVMRKIVGPPAEISEMTSRTNDNSGNDSGYESGYDEKFLKEVLDEYEDTLFTESMELPPHRGENDFHIELDPPNAKPVWRPLRHLSPQENEELRKQIKELLEKGWIRHSKSPWGATVVFAPKKDGGIRVCMDYRGLNKVTKKDRTPLPNIAEMRDRLHGAKFFTIIDIKNAYHRIRVAEDSIEKTGFRTRFGHFEYVVLPFGLTNAPATWQRLTNKILGDLYDEGIISYLDDILIFSKTEEEHKRLLREVLSRLAKHKLYVKRSKCEWAKSEVEFCGHIIGRDGLKISPRKLQVLKDWPEPRNHKEVQSFLGLTNYLLDYVDNYADIVLPLSELQSGKKQWIWREEVEQKAFRQIKEAIKKAPVLATFDPNKETYVYTDASGFAVGGWIAQPADPDDKIPSPLPKTVKGFKELPRLRPICFFSRKMKPAEIKYHTYERELLGLIKLLRANRHYLIGRPFRCFTDHKSLIYLQEQPHLSRRQAGWVELLQEFDFKIEHIPGRWNPVADVLSRNPNYAPRCITCQRRIEINEFVVGLVSAQETGNNEQVRTPVRNDDEWVKVLENDDHYQQIVDEYAPYEGKPETLKAARAGLQRYTFDEKKILFYNKRRYVPYALRGQLLWKYHDELLQGGHTGIRRTIAKLLDKYWWPKMEKEIFQYIDSCPQCQQYRDPRRRFGLLTPIPVDKKRWQVIGFDLTPMIATKDEDGITRDAALVITEYLSGRVVLIPSTMKATGRKLARHFIDHVFRNFGVPQVFISDRDSRVFSDFFEAIQMMLNIKAELSTARHQQTDGKCERMIGTVKSMLKPYLDYFGENWIPLLPILEFNINSTKNSTGMAPFEIDVGRIPEIPNEPLKENVLRALKKTDRQEVKALQEHLDYVSSLVRNQIERNQEIQEAYYNRKRKSYQFQVGQKVYLNTSGITLSVIHGRPQKFAPTWIGPFTIKAFGPHPNTYELDLLSTMFSALYPVFHADVLKPYTPPEVSPYRFNIVRPESIKVGGIEEYVPEEILTEKYENRRKVYLVKWQGWDDRWNTWEPVSHLKNTEVLKRWEQKKRDQEMLARPTN